jgi:hypothetical protein
MSIFYSLLLYWSHLSPLFLSVKLSTDLATTPVTQGAHLMFLNHETLAFSLHGQCSTSNNVDDNNAVSTLLLNINPLAFYNYTISLCFLHQQIASLSFLIKLPYIL